MTTPNKPADVGPGRVGLDNAIGKVKDDNAADNGKEGAPGVPPPKKETRGRKSKADKDAEEEKKFDDLAQYAVNLIKQPMDAYAEVIDPHLEVVGYPKGTTFAMKPEEEQGTKIALKIVISKVNPEWIAKWAPWVVCGGILLQLVVPRYLMTAKIRAHLREQEEKEQNTVDTTGKKVENLDDNPE